MAIVDGGREEENARDGARNGEKERKNGGRSHGDVITIGWFRSSADGVTDSRKIALSMRRI